MIDCRLRAFGLPRRGARHFCILHWSACFLPGRGALTCMSVRAKQQVGASPRVPPHNRIGKAMRCRQSECTRRSRTSGWCTTHYRRKRSGQDMDAPIRRYVRLEDDPGGEHHGRRSRRIPPPGTPIAATKPARGEVSALAITVAAQHLPARHKRPLVHIWTRICAGDPVRLKPATLTPDRQQIGDTRSSSG